MGFSTVFIIMTSAVPKHSFNQGKESGLTYGLNTVRLLGGSGVRGLSPLDGRDKSFTLRLPDFTSRSDQ